MGPLCPWLRMNDHHVLTLPAHENLRPDIRAKALLFVDPASVRLREQAERLAASPAPMLIQGETGTGKELLARHVHQHSGRRGPFVAVNGAAVTETLAEAEFFGHESGAFTGAQGRRAGWFEAAHGGTLFLDEVGDLPLSLQVKLLRVLQEREVTRIGGRRPVQVDVRVITATHVDLRRAVREGRFREDLFYRLHILRLTLPPLRERRGDILPLARLFLARHAREHGLLHAPALSPAAERALCEHDWPGNIRDLESTLLRGLLHAQQGLIEPAYLEWDQAHGEVRGASEVGLAVHSPEAPGEAGRATAQGPWSHVDLALQALLYQPSVELWARWERALLHSALRHNRSNQLQTARQLGISRHVLRTLMKRHRLLPTAEEH